MRVSKKKHKQKEEIKWKGLCKRREEVIKENTELMKQKKHKEQMKGSVQEKEEGVNKYQ